jgi:hypothetical protein
MDTVRVKKTRQNNNLELRSDSIRSENALVLQAYVNLGPERCLLDSKGFTNGL